VFGPRPVRSIAAGLTLDYSQATTDVIIDITGHHTTG
jgi:hypothetical protein